MSEKNNMRIYLFRGPSLDNESIVVSIQTTK